MYEYLPYARNFAGDSRGTQDEPNHKKDNMHIRIDMMHSLFPFQIMLNLPLWINRIYGIREENKWAI